MKKFPLFLLWMLILTASPAMTQEHRILLITYGADSLTVEGDNDHEQEIIIRVPTEIRYWLYLRIFDADVGGNLDAAFGFGQNWDTRTEFDFVGAKRLRREIFAVDEEKDHAWHSFVRFSPEEGERINGHYQFKLRVRGLSGDDGNLFDLFISRNPNENRAAKGVEMFSYEPTIRLPREKITAEMRFPVSDHVPEIVVHGFDMAHARMWVSTPFRSEIRVASSGQDEWKSTPIKLTEIEKTGPQLTGKERWLALNFSGGREIPNDASFIISDHKEQRLPIQLPVRVIKKPNAPPTPEIQVRYLSDCHSVAFDASGSTDKDGDRLTHFWDFGDGQHANASRVIHRYENPSQFDVALVTVDDSGQINDSSIQKVAIHVNHPPIAKAQSSKFKVQHSKFKGYHLIASPGQEIPFDGSASNDPDGEIIRQLWNFDDGSIGEKLVAPHTFEKSGHYVVSLRVEDNSLTPCNHHTDFLNVLINAQPFVKAGPDRIGAVGEIFVFAPEDTYDSDGEISNHLWDLGDGSRKQGKQITHAFAAPGEYTVELTVEDDSGTQNRAASDPFTVVVNDPPVPIGHSDFEFQVSDDEVQHRVAVGETFQFDGSESYDPDGKIIGHVWDFGDPDSGGKNRAERAKTSHVYARPGRYTVTLTVQDDSETLSEKKSVQLTVVVNDPPVPKFDIRDSSLTLRNRAATDEAVLFDASGSVDPDGRIVAHFWNFGDKSEGTGATISHPYRQPGEYPVTLTVQDDSETSSMKQSVTQTVIVNDPPVADAGPDQHVTASAVHFDGGKSKDPDGEIILHHWDFGDGSTGTGPQPVHVYGNPGTYAARLTVTDDSGTLSKQTSDEMTVIVNHKPIADAGPDQFGVPGQAIHFDASGSFDPDGHIRKYLWDLGDGKRAETSKPLVSHVYKSSGAYLVRLTLHDDTGHHAAMDKDDALVTVNARPVARITSRRQGGPIAHHPSPIAPDRVIIAAPGDAITFDGGDSHDPDGKISEWRWDFGASNSDALETVQGTKTVRRYPVPGIYSATLTVEDDSGLANARAQESLPIRINHRPTSIPGRNILTCDRTIHFDGSASADPDGDPLNCLWDFGDGSPRKTGVRAIHTYQKGGMYPVILTVDDGMALKNSTHTAAFTVAINEPPVADAGDDETVCAGDVVLFSGGRSNDPEGGMLKYQWDFGDGTTTASLNPTKIYKRGGIYQVTLTVEDDSGLACNTSSDQMVVRVAEAPVAQFGEDRTVCANTHVHFDGSVSYDVDGQINRFEWDFGDGTAGGGPTPVHVYKVPGIYPVRLTITGDPTGSCDAKDTAEIVVSVEEAPEARFTGPAIIAVGKPATFDGSESKSNGSKILSHTWDFGDGKKGKGPKATHAFRKPGRYFAGLTIKTDSKTGCNSITTRNMVVVNGPPVANAGKDQFVGVNEVVILDGSASQDADGSIVDYRWDLGDGETASGIQVRHQYQAGGGYPVTLRVIDDTPAENNSAVDKILITVNTPPHPVVSIVAKGQTTPVGEKFHACAGEKIAFRAENSVDPDGDLLKSKKSRFYWNFGDGRSAEGLRASHTYTAAGKYVCTLIVDDGSGVSNSQGQSNLLVIVNHPPVADAGPDRVVCPGETVTFDASGSRDPDMAGQPLLTCHWNFGDGHAATGEKVTHLFDKPSQYEVHLTVTDESGTICGTDEDRVFVKVNAAPVAQAGPDKEAFCRGAHDAVFFDATESHDPDGDPLSYHWDFGDDQHEVGPQVFHTYAQPGTYTVRLRIRDGQGTNCSEVQDERTVTVREREGVQ